MSRATRPLCKLCNKEIVGCSSSDDTVVIADCGHVMNMDSITEMCDYLLVLPDNERAKLLYNLLLIALDRQFQCNTNTLK